MEMIHLSLSTSLGHADFLEKSFYIQILKFHFSSQENKLPLSLFITFLLSSYHCHFYFISIVGRISEYIRKQVLLQ